VERDAAQFENWRTMEGRYGKLLEQDLIAREQYEQIKTSMIAAEATVQADRAALANTQAALAAAQASIDNARATVRADEAALEAARLQLSYTTVRSPLTGRMGRAEVRVGALVGKGEATLLATVSTMDPMYVSFSVSEREALSVWRRRADPGGIRITLPDDTEYPLEGRVDFVDRAVDPRTGTLGLRATFRNPQRVLQPGQYMRLRALLEERPAALVVPQAAVMESQGSASVYVVGPDRKVQARAVRMGPRVGELWVVEDGVKPGEQVIVKGLQRVQPGMAVEPIQG
jgi:RND family efflux transporter MFP subunit